MRDEAHVELVMDWHGLTETAALRRTTTGFSTIKELVAKADGDQPIKINAFLYASLCSAKNFDLFLKDNVDAISDDLNDIDRKMGLLENFEREAIPTGSPKLEETYLAVRPLAIRRSARDEQRTLAILLFNGPSTTEQIASELGISSNLAERAGRALGPSVVDEVDGSFALKADNDVLAVVAYILRCTLGLDPIGALKQRVGASDQAKGSS